MRCYLVLKKSLFVSMVFYLSFFHDYQQALYAKGAEVKIDKKTEAYLKASRKAVVLFLWGNVSEELRKNVVAQAKQYEDIETFTKILNGGLDKFQDETILLLKKHLEVVDLRTAMEFLSSINFGDIKTLTTHKKRKDIYQKLMGQFGADLIFILGIHDITFYPLGKYSYGYPKDADMLCRVATKLILITPDGKEKFLIQYERKKSGFAVVSPFSSEAYYGVAKWTFYWNQLRLTFEALSYTLYSKRAVHVFPELFGDSYSRESEMKQAEIDDGLAKIGKETGQFPATTPDSPSWTISLFETFENVAKFLPSAHGALPESGTNKESATQEAK